MASHVRNLALLGEAQSGKTELLRCLEDVHVGDSGQEERAPASHSEATRDVQLVNLDLALPFSALSAEAGAAASDGLSALEAKQAASERKATFRVHVLDTPGDAQFLSEVTHSALPLVDGAVVVLDTSWLVRTEYLKRVLRAAGEAVVSPVLFFNKLDLLVRGDLCGFDSLAQAHSAMYKLVQSTDSELPVAALVFGSAKRRWGFSVGTFARLYSAKFGVPEDKMATRLFGAHFFDLRKKKWCAGEPDAPGLTPSFVQFILQPIAQLTSAVLDGDTIKMTKIFAALRLQDVLKEPLHGEALLDAAMRAWLPLRLAMGVSIASYLPSPVQAMQARVETLLPGLPESPLRSSIESSSLAGATVVFFSRLFSGGVALGRVFSGRLGATASERLVVVRNRAPARVTVAGEEGRDTVPAGSLCLLQGSTLRKGQTLVDEEAADEMVPFRVAPIEHSVLVELVHASTTSTTDFATVERLAGKVGQSVPGVDVRLGVHGVPVLSGRTHAQVLHAVHSILEAGACDGVSPQIPRYFETVSAQSDEVCLAKSPNKHMRFYMFARPLRNPNDVGRTDFAWPPPLPQLAAELDVTPRKIWSTGPSFASADGASGNVLRDGTRSVQYLNEVKDAVVSAFEEVVCLDGPLCGQPLRGVEFVLEDCRLNADAIHRGAGQIIPPTRRACYAAVLKAEPLLLEPWYVLECRVRAACVGSLFSALSLAQGVVEDMHETPEFSHVHCHVPVYHFDTLVSKMEELMPEGSVPRVQVMAADWQPVQGSLSDPESELCQRTRELRQRMGMKLDLPDVRQFMDKM